MTLLWIISVHPGSDLARDVSIRRGELYAPLDPFFGRNRRRSSIRDQSSNRDPFGRRLEFESHKVVTRSQRVTTFF